MAERVTVNHLVASSNLALPANGRETACYKLIIGAQ